MDYRWPEKKPELLVFDKSEESIFFTPIYVTLETAIYDFSLILRRLMLLY